MPERLKILDQGVIFRNPLPGHRIVSAFYPCIQSLPDGELLCVMRLSGALYSPDGMLEIFRSGDGGKTWLRQGPVRDRAGDATHYSYFEGHFTRLRDGSLLMRILRADMTDADRLFFNPETQGLLPQESCFVRSRDGGRTWSEPVLADVARHFPGQTPSAYGRVIELENGTWFLIFETWKTYDDGGPFDLNSYGLFSPDGGRTWDGKVRVAVGADAHRSYSHGQPTMMHDGRLLISYWTADSQLQNSYDLHTVTSTDATARRWTLPHPTGIPGQSSCAVDMGNGRVLIAYSHRDDPRQPGIKVTLSTDGGKTFDLDHPLIIWDAYGKESLGVARSDTYPTSHDAVAYGAPKIIQLDAKRAMASFWCTQGGDTHSRWCTIALS